MIDTTTAECSVIGCILVDEHCISQIQAILPDAGAFLCTPCRKAYGSICSLVSQGKPVNLVTIQHDSGLDKQFLVECMEITPTSHAAVEYANAVKDGFVRRQIQTIGERLESDAFAHDTLTDQMITAAQRDLDILARNSTNCTAVPSGESLQSFLKFRNDVNMGKIRSFKIGFSSLDAVMGGLAPGNHYIIAARPGVGKSAFGIAIADMLAKENKVLYVSMEMTENQINARRVSAFSDVPCSYNKLLNGITSDAENKSIRKACGTLAGRHLMITDVPYMTVAQLCIQARNNRADVVIVDYLGLLSCDNPKANEYERTTQVSRELKGLAKQLNCVVIALCQLNRESTVPGADKRPKLSQLRSSGAIEQDADAVLLLHRPEYDEPNAKRNPADPERFFVDIAKNRHGRRGTIELAWHSPLNRFEDRGGVNIDKSWI